MTSNDKYARLLRPGDKWYQFGCYHLAKWTDIHPGVEGWYNALRQYRNDLPAWPVTVFGPLDDIKSMAALDDLMEGLIANINKELTEPEDQTFPTMHSVLNALKKAHLLPPSTTIVSPRFKSGIEKVVWENDEQMAGMICFAWFMAKIHGASPPGTRKFLQQIQDMILTHCEAPNPHRKPLLAVQTAHHKLDTCVVLNALNLANMYHLKRMGNVRVCKNWQEKRDQLREYRKHLFLALKASGHAWVPMMAALVGYDLAAAFEEMALSHPVRNDPADGQQTPPRSASPAPGDPFWEGALDIDAAPNSGSNSDDEDTVKPPARGKNTAKNKRKAASRRLRKSAEKIVASVYHHSGAGTPVGAAEQEATRATTPAPAPPVPTEEERKEARKRKNKAKKQRLKERKAREAAGAAAQQEQEEEVAPAPAPPSPLPSSPPYSPPPAVTPSPPASSATLGRSRPPSPAVVVPAVPAVVPALPAPAVVAPALPAPAPAPAPAAPPSSPASASPPPPPSPLHTTRLATPSGVPIPRFWALDVDSLEEDTFLPPAGPAPADQASSPRAAPSSPKEAAGWEEVESDDYDYDDGTVTVCPVVWRAARGEWVPLADVEYRAPASAVRLPAGWGLGLGPGGAPAGAVPVPAGLGLGLDAPAGAVPAGLGLGVGAPAPAPPQEWVPGAGAAAAADVPSEVVVARCDAEAAGRSDCESFYNVAGCGLGRSCSV